jgi:M6 family metalloprotease-like protein
VSKLSTSIYYDPTWYVVDYVVNELKNKIDLKEYDNNSDGYIDGIWLIYGRDNYTKLSFPSLDEQDILWAYTYWEHNNVGSLSSPKANVYGWGSYDFMYVSNNSKLKIDAHTFIHETGHMLGLDDYYDYDDETNRSGCLDMMDFNIGDHSSYSKFLLGWVTPQVYNFEKETFTIKPFESSGDCILIPASSEHSVSTMEEYLLIEFYTPTGLNEHDSLFNYLDKYPKMFTNIGLKIYHVDSRIGQLMYNDGDWLYTNYAYNFTLEDLYDYSSKISYFTIYSSNTGSVSYNPDYKLLSLISSRYGVGRDYQEYARNSDLYGVGSKLSKFKFNNGNTLNLNLIVNEINENRANFTIG